MKNRHKQKKNENEINSASRKMKIHFFLWKYIKKIRTTKLRSEMVVALLCVALLCISRTQFKTIVFTYM